MTMRLVDPDMSRQNSGDVYLISSHQMAAPSFVVQFRVINRRRRRCFCCESTSNLNQLGERKSEKKKSLFESAIPCRRCVRHTPTTVVGELRVLSISIFSMYVSSSWISPVDSKKNKQKGQIEIVLLRIDSVKKSPNLACCPCPFNTSSIVFLFFFLSLIIDEKIVNRRDNFLLIRFLSVSVFPSAKTHGISILLDGHGFDNELQCPYT